MKTFAKVIIERRIIFLAAISLMTLFFLYQIVTNLTVKTIFSDLLPRNHAYVQLHEEIRNSFGGANQVYIMVQTRQKEEGGKYENIFNRKLNWTHKITTDLANQFEVIILEDLNVRGMQKFNSGISKSVTLDFSWNQFVNILEYKMISSNTA